MPDAASTGNAAFVKASEEVKTLKTQPSNEEMLQLYGLFKQAIFGENTTKRPGMLELQAKAKWDAWTSRKDMTKEDAQAEYIKVVETLKAKLGTA